MLAVRWWWLKGLRARQADQADEALVCFRRCEKVLKGRKIRRRRRLVQSSRSTGRNETKQGVEDKEEEEEGDGGGEEEEAVVLLPHCVVHQRVDLQVKMGMLRSNMEFSILGRKLLELLIS